MYRSIEKLHARTTGESEVRFTCSTRNNINSARPRQNFGQARARGQKYVWGLVSFNWK